MRNYIKLTITSFLLASCMASCSWIYHSDEPTRDEKLMMQAEILKHQKDELESQEKEKEDIERQNYHNKLLKRYE